MNVRHPLLAHHKEHCRKIGMPEDAIPKEIDVHRDLYLNAYDAARRSHPAADCELVHTKALAHLAWLEHQKPATKRVKARDYRWELRALILLLLLLGASRFAHCQFSKISVIQFQANDNSTVGVIAAPYNFKAGANCGLSKSGATITFNCTGGAAAAGGSSGQVQWNNATALAGVSTLTTDGTVVTQKAGVNYLIVDPTDPTKKFQFVVSGVTAGNTRSVTVPDANSYTIKAGASTGQIPIWNNVTSTYDVSDPLVQGTQAAGSTSLPNPVVGGGQDYSGTPTVRTFKVDSSGFLHVFVESAPTTAVTGTFWQATQPVSGTFWQATQPVSGTFWQATQPVSAASLPLPTGAAADSSLSTLDTDLKATQPRKIMDAAGNARGANVNASNQLSVSCDNGCAGGSSTPADTFSNPTTAGLSISFGALWNGTTWDRQYGDKTNGAFVNVKTSVLPTGAALDSSLSTIDTDLKANITLHAGTAVIGHVIADSGSTTAVTGNVASTVADGANVTLGAKADAKSTATDTTAITMMQVLKQISASVQAPPSQAVTNAGTFAVQSAATLSAETTKVIGTVRNVGNAGATFDQAPGSAVPTNAVQIGGTDGTNTRVPYLDPCQYSAWTYYYVNVSSNTQIAGLAGTSKNYYLCEAIILPVAAAVNVNLVSSGTANNACATSATAWLTGGATAALGGQFAINGGIVMPPTPSRAYAVTQATNHAICIFTSATVTGVIAYAGPL